MSIKTADEYANEVIAKHMKAIGSLPVDLIIRGAIISAFNAGVDSRMNKGEMETLTVGDGKYRTSLAKKTSAKLVEKFFHFY